MEKIVEMLFGSFTAVAEGIRAWGYPGIIFLMTIESSFFPFPSEVVMIPAGYWSHRGEMNVVLAVLSGIFGSMLGAWFNYYLSVWLGRPLILKIGRYFWISEEKFAKVEKFFQEHGEITTFVGRLIPGVRQIISCPAGMARMNMLRFSIYTAAGAGLWVIVLTLFGWFIGMNEELIHKYKIHLTVGSFVFCCITVAVYIAVRKRRKNRAMAAPKEA